MADERKVVLKTEVDATGAKVGFDQVKQGARDMAASVEQAGKSAAKGMDALGESGSGAAKKVERDARSMIASIQRATAELEAGTKANNKYYEAIAAQRGINASVLKPYLDQLEEARKKADEAAKSQEKLKQAFGDLKDIGKAALALGAFAASAAAVSFYNTIKGTLEAADAIGKLSQRTGIATEQLSQLQFAAKLSGVGTDSLTAALRKLNVSLSEAQSGDRTKAEVFKVLGVSLRDAAGNATTADKALLQIADTFAKAKDGAGKTALAVEVLGKAGDEMIPLLNGGSQAIKDLMDRAQKLGITIGGDFSNKAQEFNDNVTILEAASQKLGIAMTAQLVPALNAIVLKMIEATEAGGKMRGILAGIHEAANRAFNWDAIFIALKISEVNKELANVQKNIRNIENAPFNTFNLFGDLAKEKEKLRALTVELDALSGAYYRARYPDAGQKAAATTPTTPNANKPELKPPAKPDTSAESQYEGLIQKINERLRLAKEELTAGRQLTEGEKFEAQTLEQLTGIKSKVTAEQKRAVLASLEEAKARDLLVAIQRSEVTQAQETAKARQEQRTKDYEQSKQALLDIEEANRKAISTVNDQVAALQLESEATQMAAQKNISLAEAIELVRIARLREKQAMTTEGGEAWQAIEKEIEARQKLATLQGAKATEEEWKKTAEKIQDSLTDALMRGFESGKGFARNLRDTVVNMFKTMVLRPIINAVMGPVAGSMMGAMGFPTAAAGTAAGGFGGSSMLGATGMAASLAGFGGSFGAGVGMTLAGDTMAAFGAGSAAMAGGSTGAGLGMIAGAAAPLVLAAIALYAIAQTMKGETRSGGQYGYGAANQTNGTVGNYGGVTLMSGPSGGQIAGDQVTKAITATIDSINSLLKGAGSTAYITGFQAALESSGNSRGGVYSGGTLSSGATFGESGVGNNYAGTLYEKGTPFSLDSEAALKAFTLDLKQVTIEALQAATDIPRAISEKLKGVDAEKLTDDEANALLASVNTIITGVVKFSAALDSLPFDSVRQASFDAKAAIIEFSGGIDQLAQNLGAYYQNFFSAGEQRAQTLKNIAATLQKAGIGITAETLGAATRAQFRALVESIDVTTEAGQRMYAAMMSVAGAFSSITPEATAAGDALQQTISGLDGLIESLTSTVQTLESSTSRLRTFATDVRAFRDQLLLSDLSPLTPAQRYATASSQFSSTLAAAQAGDPTAQSQLTSMAQAFLQASQTYNASGSGYTADFAKVQAALTTVAAGADAAATVAEQQLNAARAQLEEAQSQRTLAQQQLEELNAITQAVNDNGASVATSISDLAAAIRSMSGGTDTAAAITAMYQTLLNRAPDTAGLNYWMNSGLSLSDIMASIMSSSEYLAIPGHAGGGLASGLSLVGESGPELVDFSTPARVYTADQTAGMFAGSAELVDRMDTLIERVKALEELQVEGTKALINANYQANEIAAERVVEGTARTSERSAWKRKMASEATPA